MYEKELALPTPLLISVDAVQRLGLNTDNPGWPAGCSFSSPPAANGESATANSPVKPRGKASVNARMLETIRNDPDAMRWNSTKWAKQLHCAKSSVVGTQAWKDLTMGRERQKAECALDRRRRPKGGDSNRD